MQTFTANEAKTRFGELLDRVQREPVQVTKHNRVIGVMVSAEDYQSMRAYYVDRLQRTMRETAEAAAAKGLTDEKLAQLLNEETYDVLCEISKERKCSIHSLMTNALQQYAQIESQKEVFRKDTLKAWEEYKTTGLHVSADKVSQWLNSIGTDNEQAAPECHL